MRRAAAEVDQVLHVGFGPDRAGGALYRLWEDVHAARSGQRTVAVTTCRYAYGYVLSRCEGVPLLLYSYPQHLGQLLDNPHLRLALDRKKRRVAPPRGACHPRGRRAGSRGDARIPRSWCSHCAREVPAVAERCAVFQGVIPAPGSATHLVRK